MYKKKKGEYLILVSGTIDQSGNLVLGLSV